MDKVRAENLERKNRRLWDAEDIMGDAALILHEETERDPADAELKELETRLYRLWSDYLNYLNRKPYTAKERADIEWTAGRIGRQVLERVLADKFGDEDGDDHRG